MAIIKSGVSADSLTIDITSKAARLTLYGRPSQTNRGTKHSYRAATEGETTVSGSTTGLTFIITGSATKIVIVHRLAISYTRASGVITYVNNSARKYLQPPAITGTEIPLTKVPLDSSSPASTVDKCQLYNGSPSGVALIGSVATRRKLLQDSVAAAPDVPEEFRFDFGTQRSENFGLYLRSTEETLAYVFGSAISTIAGIEVEWTEE